VLELIGGLQAQFGALSRPARREVAEEADRIAELHA